MFSQQLRYVIVDNVSEHLDNSDAVRAFASILSFRKKQLKDLYPDFTAIDAADIFAVHIATIWQDEIVATMRLVPVLSHQTYGSISHYIHAMKPSPDLVTSSVGVLADLLSGENSRHTCEFGKAVVHERFRGKRSGLKEDLFKVAVGYAHESGFSTLLTLTNETAKLAATIAPIGFRDFVPPRVLHHSSGTVGRLMMCERISEAYLALVESELARIHSAREVFSFKRLLSTKTFVRINDYKKERGIEHGA